MLKKVLLRRLDRISKRNTKFSFFLHDDRYICSGLKKHTISIGHRTNFFASRPSLCGGGYMRYQLWISANDAFTGFPQIFCIISKDNANRNTLK